MIDLNLLLSTILMLKKSTLKNYLCKLMNNLNKLKIKDNFEVNKIIINENVIEDICIILENMDEWIRHYNSEMKISMKKELITNLKKLKKIFKILIIQ